MFFSKPQFAS